MSKRRGSGERGMIALFLAVLLVLGVAIPAWTLTGELGRSATPKENVDELTEAQKRGRELFAQSCRNCHTLKAAAASARVGPNLDAEPRDASLVLDAIEKGRNAGNGTMPAATYEGEDAEAVAEFVAVATGGKLD